VTRLAGKSVLVTGGASGLGRAIAARFAVEGADVTISDVQRDVGNETARELGVTFVEHDVRAEEQWANVVAEIERDRGRLDVLVNCAGILGPMTANSPVDTPLDDWKRIFAVNTDGVFLGCRAAIPTIARAGGGAIVNISSIAGLVATPYAAAYGASKAAVRQLTKSVAEHCAEQRLNIRCNSIHPGDVRTPLWDRGAEETARSRGVPVDEVIEEHRATIPLGEFTTPEDIAAAALFLASDEARCITGIALIVDGGRVNCDSFRAAQRATE
jgi:3(or 17)beta-hydroxysteroid dehydrogenase